MPKAMRVNAWRPTMTGEGESLELSVKCTRTTLKGTRQSFELTLLTDRWFITKLIEQLAAMQVRDRERLQRETDRLTDELAPLTGKKS